MNIYPLLKKSISVMLLVLFLFLAAHYFLSAETADILSKNSSVCNLVLMGLCLFIVVVHQKKRNISRECSKKHSTQTRISLHWTDYCLFGYFLILILYIIAVPMQTPQNIFMRGFCFTILFAYSFYNILRAKASVLSKILVGNAPLENSETESRQYALLRKNMQPDAEKEKYRFVDKRSEYKVMLEWWMQTQKPYLNKDFKLLDVMQLLPLNRSYLSRMFNEVYGETFFCFIMRYRIEESVRMLDACPELTAAQIAQRCGFSSASVFGRAFLKNMGMTPKEYRNRKRLQLY